MDGDNEEENELRLHCIRQLEKNKRYGIASSFAAELLSKNNVRVRRAAYALADGRVVTSQKTPKIVEIDVFERFERFFD